jgi:hypothetical protein
MLQELYMKELNEFAQKAVISIEKGFDVLPLLKRRLEEQEMPVQENRKLPATVFLSAVFIAMVLFSRIHPVVSYIIMAADIIVMVLTLRK